VQDLAYKLHNPIPWYRYGLRQSRIAQAIMVRCRTITAIDAVYHVSESHSLASFLILASTTDADTVLDLLGGLPLALTQAGAFMREMNVSALEYAQHCKQT
jgi:hypothetical protein